MYGIEPVWASEIEAFPIKVTSKRFPNMKHLGDIMKIDGATIDPVDIITFGSPCQDLSVAGKRAGLLDGSRSNLFMEAIRIIREMRDATNNEYPRYIMWENVPGAFSSNKGNDFRVVLEEITQTEIPMPQGGKWTTAGMVELPECQVAWRVMDSQFWGVPQRRKRIFLIGDLRGFRAGEILFECKSLLGDSQQSCEEGEGIASDPQGGIRTSGTDYLSGRDNQEKRVFTDKGVSSTLAGSDGGGGRTGVGYVLPLHGRTVRRSTSVLFPEENKVGSLVARADGSPCIDRGQPFVVTAGFMAGQGSKAGGIGYKEEVSPTLKSVLSGGNTVPSIVRIEIFDARGNGNGDISPTLTGDHQNRVTDYTAIAAYGVGNGQANQSLDHEKVGALNCMHDQQAVLVSGVDCRNATENPELSPTLQAYPKGGYSLNCTHPVRIGKMVRRLTPKECCRLQGFPDGWCDGIPHSDTAEYKMWGNGMALPCVKHIIENTANVQQMNLS